MATTTDYDVYNLTHDRHGNLFLGSSVATDVAIDNGGSNVLGASQDDTFKVDGDYYTYLGYGSLNGVTGIVAENAHGSEVFIVLTGSNVGTNSQLYDFVRDDPYRNRGEWNIKDAAPECFVAGTLILTPKGERPVETLKAGDEVITASGAIRPIRWVGVTTISLLYADPVALRPIVIRAGALGDNVPARDLRVSPGHALKVGNILASAQALLNGVSVVRDEAAPLVFTYHHLELDAHDLLVADGAPAESFIPQRSEVSFDNAAERASLNLAPLTEMALPRALSRRQLPQTLRVALLERANQLYGVAEAA